MFASYTGMPIFFIENLILNDLLKPMIIISTNNLLVASWGKGDAVLVPHVQLSPSKSFPNANIVFKQDLNLFRYLISTDGRRESILNMAGWIDVYDKMLLAVKILFLLSWFSKSCGYVKGDL